MSMWHVGGHARFFALIAFSFLALGCQKSKFSGDLPTPNGQFATVTNAYPAVVMVVAPEGKGICTGTFVSPRAVLTAAHCLSVEGQYSVVSSFGTFRTSTFRNYGPGEVEDPRDIALLIFDTDVASREKGQVYDIEDDVREGDEARLIGFGCNDIQSRRGAGVKRTGTNVVADLSDYIEFVTPLSSSRGAVRSRNIFGPSNRAASCFGDSGGPAALERNGTLYVVGVTHAGGSDGNNQISYYANVANRSDNRSFLRVVNAQFGLDIRGI